ncbi:uncharacterized protein LOC131938389 [Physella acuta]|uniref:uncharacterized protein LOC131938389 n=1 Tax=Physella acuta TaxID=109671 RepID=UPI0027DD9829|nr:uncharacterized protein LOC131938389 [Physella acuta]
MKKISLHSVVSLLVFIVGSSSSLPISTHHGTQIDTLNKSERIFTNAPMVNLLIRKQRSTRHHQQHHHNRWRKTMREIERAVQVALRQRREFLTNLNAVDGASSREIEQAFRHSSVREPIRDYESRPRFYRYQNDRAENDVEEALLKSQSLSREPLTTLNSRDREELAIIERSLRSQPREPLTDY